MVQQGTCEKKNLCGVIFLHAAAGLGSTALAASWQPSLLLGSLWSFPSVHGCEKWSSNPSWVSDHLQSIHVLERTASSSTEPSASRQLLEPEPLPLSKVSDSEISPTASPVTALGPNELWITLTFDSCKGAVRPSTGLLCCFLCLLCRDFFLPCMRGEEKAVCFPWISRVIGEGLKVF